MKPYNKRLMLKIVDNERSDEDRILFVPDDYKEEERYKLCGVLEVSDDISFLWPFAVIESHLIESVEVSGETYHFAPVSAVAMVCDSYRRNKND